MNTTNQNQPAFLTLQQPAHDGQQTDVKAFVGLTAVHRFFGSANMAGIGSVSMQDIVGNYEVPSTVPEWDWVEAKSSFQHKQNGSSPGVWDFVLNLALDFENIPEKLQPVIAEARAKNLAYLMFHQGH